MQWVISAANTIMRTDLYKKEILFVSNLFNYFIKFLQIKYPIFGLRRRSSQTPALYPEGHTP